MRLLYCLELDNRRANSKMQYNTETIKAKMISIDILTSMQ